MGITLITPRFYPSLVQRKAFQNHLKCKVSFDESVDNLTKEFSSNKLMDSSIHGILPGKNTGVVTIFFSRGSSRPRN